MASKHDWDALKTDYMTSSFLDVQDWGRQKFSNSKASRSGGFLKKTLGWRVEKELLKKQQSELTVQKVLEDRSTKLAQALADTYDHLIDNKEKLFAVEGIRAIEKTWQMLMIANGLPTSISKNENTNKSLDADKKVMIELVNKAKNAKRKHR